MASTPVKVPDLPVGLTSVTMKILHPTTLSVEETVSLTYSGESYNGTATGTSTGQKIFKILTGTTLIASRLRTIEDTTDTFVIMTELEERASDGRGGNVATITVDDFTDPIPDALVRVSKPGISATRYTNASGIVKFLLDDGTYDVAIIATGFQSTVEALVVSGASSDTFSLEGLEITPPDDALLSTGIMVVYDEFGIVEDQIEISLKLVSGPGTDGYALDTKTRTEVSDVAGLVQFEGLVRGATYQVWRGGGTGTGTPAPSIFATRVSGSATFVVPNSSSFNLPEITGADLEA